MRLINMIVKLTAIASVLIMSGAISATACLCIDAGHGGNDSGSVGPILHVGEKEVNLSVALHLRDSLVRHGYFEGSDFILIRHTDTLFALRDRALIACQNYATEFLSIHHNSFTSPTVQGSEVYYCNQEYTPYDETYPYSHSLREPYDTLAKKVYYEILEGWEYNARGVKTANYLVLAYTTMIGVLSEASFLSEPAEEELFADPYQYHIRQEAHALYTGWRSYVDRQGFGRIEYRYMGQQPHDSPLVMVDYEIHTVPYERTWPLYSQHTLNTENFWVGDQYYQFACWKDVEYSTGRVWYEYSQPQIGVAAQWTNDNYHYYEAFFKGGPFNFNLLEPNPAITYLNPGVSQQIKWGAPSGAFDACSLQVSFSSNNGSTWQNLTSTLHYHHNSPPLANQGYINWTVPSISSGNCRLRLIYWDFVGNIDTTISHQFAIGCAMTQARFVWEKSPYYNWPVKISFYDQSTNFPTSWYWDFGDGHTSTLANPTSRPA